MRPQRLLGCVLSHTEVNRARTIMLCLARYNGLIMATSIQHHPLTVEQRTQLDQDLTIIQERLQNIAVLMHAGYGEESHAAIRADEVDGALQRLKWELERMQEGGAG